ncbi:hypothetical protein [Nitrospina gracilis]|uniref:hypothetical protein n=1 Tax=Nitrospina gracilis TaxID=35801 RepID=UPI001F207942|nr:hypothetical protein [Nitrospina gracilis]MCF8720915.1 hypothetical protein [Nitrospina gracilis Nb-211]
MWDWMTRRTGEGTCWGAGLDKPSRIFRDSAKVSGLAQKALSHKGFGDFAFMSFKKTG